MEDFPGQAQAHLSYFDHLTDLLNQAHKRIECLASYPLQDDESTLQHLDQTASTPADPSHGRSSRTKTKDRSKIKSSRHRHRRSRTSTPVRGSSTSRPDLSPAEFPGRQPLASRAIKALFNTPEKDRRHHRPTSANMHRSLKLYKTRVRSSRHNTPTRGGHPGDSPSDPSSSSSSEESSPPSSSSDSSQTSSSSSDPDWDRFAYAPSKGKKKKKKKSSKQKKRKMGKSKSRGKFRRFYPDDSFPFHSIFGTGSSRKNYCPHYLLPDGESKRFYKTLPEPWNVLPIHAPVSFTQVAAVQKSGLSVEFDGTCSAYRNFRDHFIISIHRLDLPIVAKFSMLRNSLAKIKELKTLLDSTPPGIPGYAVLIRRLEEKYGGSARLLAMYLAQLRAVPVVQQHDLLAAESLFDAAQGYIAALQHSNESPDSHVYFSLIKGKLSHPLKLKYMEYCSIKRKRDPHKVSTLLKWLHNFVITPLRLDPFPPKATNTPTNLSQHK